MPTLIEKLDYLMQSENVNKVQLAKESAIPYTTIDGFYKRGTDNIKLSTLKKLANYFRCSMDYLTNENIRLEEVRGMELKEILQQKREANLHVCEWRDGNEKGSIAEIRIKEIELQTMLTMEISKQIINECFIPNGLSYSEALSVLKYLKGVLGDHAMLQ